MALIQRRASVPPAAGTAPSLWPLAAARAMALLVGALAVAGIIVAVMRANVMLLAVCWTLISLAMTALFALSRSDARR